MNLERKVNTTLDGSESITTTNHLNVGIISNEGAPFVHHSHARKGQSSLYKLQHYTPHLLFTLVSEYNDVQ